jgi:cob(I)alamin adenosyltransferase
MGITTKKGDKGETSVLSGERVSKNDIIIHFEGTADELGSHLGLIKVMLQDSNTRQFIEEIQTILMKLIAHVSDSKNKKYFFSEEETAVLEKEINRLSEKLPKQFKFVLPGKSILEAHIHIARTVARRAERMFVAVNSERELCPHAASYMNRLSDYLFVLSQQDYI